MASGRFAPSPTGDLHLGNLRTALAAWLFARSVGSDFVVRFEDLDRGTASRKHESRQAESLRQLGLDWDGTPLRQSERFEKYRDVISDLTTAGLTYRCWCSRREIREAASAPHGRSVRYPGTCRDLSAAQISALEDSGRPPALRLRCSSDRVGFSDLLRGPQQFDVDDFVLQRGDGTPSYNLAVVIDDADQEIDQVVRADDLLDTTSRQVYLQHLLGLPTPTYAHVPLVLAEDGSRLAKRHGAVTLADRLQVGDSPQRLVSVLATSLGIRVPGPHTSPGDLIATFDPSAIVLRPWVLSSASIGSPL